MFTILKDSLGLLIHLCGRNLTKVVHWAYHSIIVIVKTKLLLTEKTAFHDIATLGWITNDKNCSNTIQTPSIQGTIQILSIHCPSRVPYKFYNVHCPSRVSYKFLQCSFSIKGTIQILQCSLSIKGIIQISTMFIVHQGYHTNSTMFIVHQGYHTNSTMFIAMWAVFVWQEASFVVTK